jgi:hypothetical protein
MPAGWVLEKEGNYAAIQTMDNYDITGSAKTRKFNFLFRKIMHARMF